MYFSVWILVSILKTLLKSSFLLGGEKANIGLKATFQRER